MPDNLLDCIVVGAGPAGLSASLFLARYQRPALTFHHNSPRNLYSHGVHGFLGHHGIQPHELLERGRCEVAEHGGQILERCVSSVKQLADDCFQVEAGRANEPGESYYARRLILATGLRDLTPDCPGFREFYGVSVHHCPDCDGYEHRGKKLVVLGHGKRVAGFALTLLTWTDQIVVVTNGEPGDMTEAHRAQLAGQGIEVVDRRVIALQGELERQQLKRVCLDDGTIFAADALFFSLGTEPASDLHTQLGCALDPEHSLVQVDEHQQTSIPGVYAAGDLTPNSQLAVVAAAEGAMAAIQVHRSLQPAARRIG